MPERHRRGECWRRVDAGHWRDRVDNDDAPGYELWRGPSRLNGAPVVLLITNLGQNPSKNAKTGAEAQTWIMRSDCAPTEAVRTGADEAICGDCALRPTAARALRAETGERQPVCYINTVRGGPWWVWKNWEKGNYPVADPVLIGQIAKYRRRPIRIGSYGDPAAVPKEVWDAILARQEEHTGYTHQWRTHPEYAASLMASVNNEQEREQAKALGFRTFRVLRIGEAARPGEIMCPSTSSSGRFTSSGARITCERCQLCSGAEGKGRVDIAITDHGPSVQRGQRMTDAERAGQSRRRHCTRCGHPQVTHGLLGPAPRAGGLLRARSRVHRRVGR